MNYCKAHSAMKNKSRTDPWISSFTIEDTGPKPPLPQPTDPQLDIKTTSYSVDKHDSQRTSEQEIPSHIDPSTCRLDDVSASHRPSLVGQHSALELDGTMASVLHTRLLAQRMAQYGIIQSNIDLQPQVCYTHYSITSNCLIEC